MRHVQVLCRALLPVVLVLYAGTGSGLATEVPYLGGRVNDHAGLLTSETTVALEAMLKAHEDSTSNQVVVLTVTTLEGEEIEPFAIRVAETWKLGRKGKDNGVLLLVAKSERKVRIEVGRGLEGNLTDLTCGRIIRHEIVPRFKEGDYDGGIRAGTVSILAAIAGAYTADGEGEGGEGIVEMGVNLFAFGFFLVVITPFTLVAFFSRGFPSWFLYAFLIPFWTAFPMATIGAVAGGILCATYLIGFPIAKFILAKTVAGKAWAAKWGTFMVSRSGHGGSWGSSGGGWSSSSGGGSSFSGGGGSFSGGGSSGSW
jgi:uncharacterized protein